MLHPDTASEPLVQRQGSSTIGFETLPVGNRDPKRGQSSSEVATDASTKLRYTAMSESFCVWDSFGSA